MTDEYHVVTREELHAFVKRCMKAAGTADNQATAMADCLTMADYRGHYSHGLNRLEFYVNDVKEKASAERVGAEDPVVLKESPATAYVDGKNQLGPVVGKFCMDIAIKKAKAVGVAWVVAKGSNHFGTAELYSMMAMQEGLIGMCFTNASPFVATACGKKPFFGTNPMSVAAAGVEEDFVLDMATSVTAYGKVELQARKAEPMPDTWAIDATGKPTTDPKKFSALLPLGGLPATGGFKGTGLAMMIEIFCAVLSDSACAPNVRHWDETDKVANLGQCFVAVDPECFAPNFKQRMSKLIHDVKAQEPVEGVQEIMVAGEPERRHMKLCDKEGGIPFHHNQITYAQKLAESLKVDPLKVVRTCPDPHRKG